jgi:hypothetical protein
VLQPGHSAQSTSINRKYDVVRDPDPVTPDPGWVKNEDREPG